MPDDSLSAMAHELAQLPAGDRHAVLAALTFEERQRLRDVTSAPQVRRSPSSTDPADHSPWFQALVAQAQSLTSSKTMTPAARSALLDTIDAQSSGLVATAGRSLMQAAGGLLSPGRVKR